MNEEAYLQRNISCEEVDSDDLEGGLLYSDCEDASDVREVMKLDRASKRMKKGKKAATKYRQEVDTNVFQLNLACLKETAEMATGDPELCTKCQAVLNKFSKVEGNEGE